jgi:hypothetical protein
MDHVLFSLPYVGFNRWTRITDTDTF